MDNLRETLEEWGKIPLSIPTQLDLPSIDYSAIVRNINLDDYVAKVPEEATLAYQLQKQTNQIIEKANEQTKLLAENYQRLEDLYKLKEKELEEAKTEANKAKRYNTVMLILTIVSALVAVAAWLLPNILGGAS